jgi:hypothetical protein
MSNQKTLKAGLTWNVNTVSQYTKNLFKSKGYVFETKDKESGEVTEKAPQLSNGPTAITSAIQEIAQMLLKITAKKTVTDISGVNTLNRSIVTDAIRLNPEWNEYYNWKLQSFNKDQMYDGVLPVSSKELQQFINNFDKNFIMTPKARNLFIFMISEAYVQIVNTAFHFIKFANKKTLSSESIKAAVNISFPSTIAKALITRIDRAISAAGDDVDDEDGEENEAVKDSDNDQSDDEAPAKKTKKAAKGKKDTKSTKTKKVAKIEESDGDESNDDADEQASSEDEVQEVVKSKGKKSKTRRANK